MQAFHRLGSAINTVGAIMLALLCQGALAQDNNATIAVGYQRGLAYLPVILMEQQRLFEKHATRLGLKTTAEYRLLGGPAPIVDGNPRRVTSDGAEPPYLLVNTRCRGAGKDPRAATPGRSTATSGPRGTPACGLRGGGR